jgi:hypothetical protein
MHIVHSQTYEEKPMHIIHSQTYEELMSLKVGNDNKILYETNTSS